MNEKIHFKNLSIWLKFAVIVAWIIGAIWLFALGAFFVGVLAGLLS